MSKFVLFDGAMGTLCQQLYGMNALEALEEPKRIQHIHEMYIEAGSDAILTDTFDISREKRLDLIDAACRAATSAAPDSVTVYGDIGPADEDGLNIYKVQIDRFLDNGITHFLFETMSSTDDLLESAEYIFNRCPEAVVGLSFAIGTDGMSRQGISVRELLETAASSPYVSFVGLNCHCSPYHMYAMLPKLDLKGKPLLVKPNAGYPQVLGHCVIYDSDPEYFAAQCVKMASKGAVYFGGCCGTTPEHIRALKRELATAEAVSIDGTTQNRKSRHRPSFMNDLDRKIIAVELDPPVNDEISPFINGIGTLKTAGADMVTIADNPIGRPRADSSILACKVRRETGLEVLPHLTCRDRNLNAVKSLLLGLSIEDVHQVLAVTGDPLPAESRDEVKSVYNFNSRKLAAYITRLNDELFSQPMHVFGALDLNARNFDVQETLAAEKLANGMEGFLTQPILSQSALDNLIRFRKRFPEAVILAGIFPVVSERNAIFLNNEVNGIIVADEIIERYAGLDRAGGEQLARTISKAVAEKIYDFCDGYYIMTPFQRVGLVSRIISDIRVLESKNKAGK